MAASCASSPPPSIPSAPTLLGCETGQAIRDEIARVVPFYDGIQHLQRSRRRRSSTAARTSAPADASPPPTARRTSAPCRCRRSTAPPGTFAVSTRRGKQFNTLIYAEIDPLTGAARDAVLHEPRRRRRAAPRATATASRCVNEHGRFEGRVLLAPIARGNLQVHWPEGNVLIRRGVVDPLGGVPDYNAVVRVEVHR